VGSGGQGSGNAGAPWLGSSENGNPAGDDGDEAAGSAEGDADGRSEATGLNEEPYGDDAPPG